MRSPDGSTLPPAASLVDANDHVWTVTGGGVRVDGDWAGIVIADVRQLLAWEGVVYLQQPDGAWFWRHPESGDWRSVVAPDAGVLTVLVSGQSNGVGIAVADGGEIAPMPNVLAWDGHDSWPIAAEPLPFAIPSQPAHCHGSWLALGQAALSWCRQVRLTGYAKGSQIINHWDVGQPGWTALVAAIAAAPSIAAFIWHQGESDADAAVTVAAYHDKLVDLIARVRAATRATLPVLICGIGPFDGAGTDYVGIRTAQQAVAAELVGVQYVSTLSYPFFEGEHLTAAGYRQLGVTLAARLQAVM